MTLTPHRDAVDQTVAATRERYAEVMARNDAAGIGQRMSIETCEAILGGMADMLDRGVALEKVWPQIAMAEAGALASFLLSAAHGDAAAAERLLPGALVSIQELALARLRRKPEEWVVGTSVAPRSAGQG